MKRQTPSWDLRWLSHSRPRLLQEARSPSRFNTTRRPSARLSAGSPRSQLLLVPPLSNNSDMCTSGRQWAANTHTCSANVSPSTCVLWRLAKTHRLSRLYVSLYFCRAIVDAEGRVDLFGKRELGAACTHVRAACVAASRSAARRQSHRQGPCHIHLQPGAAFLT